MAWPKQSPAAMSAFYGNPDSNGDGSPSPKWEAANLISIKPPYRMVLAWDPARLVKSIRVHKECAQSLLRVLEAIKAHYGTQAAIEAARMHLYGGCYNFRLKRDGSSLSIHSWGAAIDMDPERNGFGVKWRDGRGMMPLAVVRIFEAEGWDWGGLWSKPDAMHFQAAKTGQKPAAIAPPARKAPVPATRHRPAPEAAPEASPRPTAETVLYVQTRLRELGYSEVGAVDGIAGDQTETAILAFRKNNGLDLTPAIDDALLVALPKAPPRVLAPERTGATPKEVRAEIPEVRANWFGKVWSAIAGAGAVLAGVASWLVEHLDGIREQLRPLLDALGDVPLWLYCLLFAGAAFIAWQRMRKGEASGIAAFQSGERR